jgi:hypothetical protein
VADIDTPHAGGCIEQSIALAVVNINTLAPVQQRALMLADFDEVIPGMNKQIVALLDFCRCAHALLSSTAPDKAQNYIYILYICKQFQ